MSESNAVIGQRIQEKFQFYILGLIFTLLGLAVQTASFGSVVIADLFELGSWVCFLLSALVMISRLEWAPQFYGISDVQQELKAEQQRLS
jgi:NhaP-type Na+/H+ or K+/H+ antiporter